MKISTATLRRTTTTVLASGLIALASPLAATTAHAAAAPAVSGAGAYLLDNAKGTKLYGKADNTRRQMASTTKIMTAAVVLSQPKVDLNRKVTIKKEYRDYVKKEGASTADLQIGDKVTVGQLLYGLLLPSGCDAAYALADTYGTGSTPAARTKSFIAKMNQQAKSLNLKNSGFDSFDGISGGGKNYTTPADLAQIARYAMSKPAFRNVVKSPSYRGNAVASTGKTRTYTWYNTNQLLKSYKGAIGVKTGTGTAAGPCLVFAATRGNKTLIGVVLNGKDRYKDAAKLLDYGFGTKSATSMKLAPLPKGAQRD